MDYASERQRRHFLLRGTIGEIRAVPSGGDVTLRCLAESVAIAAQVGPSPREKFAKATKPILTARASSLVTLIYRDMQNGLPVNRTFCISVEGAQTRPRHAAPRRRDAATVDLPEPTVAKA